MKEFKLHINDWSEKVKEEIDILRNFWLKDKLPPAIPRTYGGKECDYCAYKGKCKEVENAAKGKVKEER